MLALIGDPSVIDLDSDWKAPTEEWGNWTGDEEHQTRDEKKVRQCWGWPGRPGPLGSVSSTLGSPAQPWSQAPSVVGAFSCWEEVLGMVPAWPELAGAGEHLQEAWEGLGELAGSGSSSPWYCRPKQQTLGVCTPLLLTFSNTQAFKEVWSPELTQPSQHLRQPERIYLSLLIRGSGDSDTVVSWVEL